jgi:hypothetical protein
VQSPAADVRAQIPVPTIAEQYSPMAHIDPAPQDVEIAHQARMRREASRVALRRRYMQYLEYSVPRIPLPGTGVKIALAVAPFSWFRGGSARAMDHFGE